MTFGSTLPWQMKVPTGSTPSGKQFAALIKLSLACAICGGTPAVANKAICGLCNVPSTSRASLLAVPLSTQNPANTRS